MCRVALGGDDAGNPNAAMTPEDAVRHVLATNPTFAVHDIDVRGVTFKAGLNMGTARSSTSPMRMR